MRFQLFPIRHFKIVVSNKCLDNECSDGVLSHHSKVDEEFLGNNATDNEPYFWVIQGLSERIKQHFFFLGLNQSGGRKIKSKSLIKMTFPTSPRSMIIKTCKQIFKITL